MVDRDYVDSQLKEINFGYNKLNRSEINELQNILIPEERIYECVNGFYEGGVALLVATDMRVLLIDKKPMGFLNVDDVRFDMISDIDYSHRAFGAQININCGMKNLVFKSYNQQRLRKLIGHVQHRMSEIKREQTSHASEQKQHLEEINKQLQMYLLAQQRQLERQLAQNDRSSGLQPVKPSPELADYLFAQRLMEEFQGNNSQKEEAAEQQPIQQKSYVSAEPLPSSTDQQLLEEMAEAGRREVFGGGDKISHAQPVAASTASSTIDPSGIDITPFKIAYAKLPYLLKTRRFHPSNNAHAA